ncbi:hypothetical protein GCK72_006801 [Caenorhabditis remanei]|uniref:T20D4.11-like domain-containing protein n=1 Tax=Caenorhabditis remanei TaxID=31234 RepID=A0A6A5HKC0_CAERE|nr:hypothetical protein GCK72_006801 [Caenorhabditis remanei]KAF1766843.1 hypothetical protein GCK72_006801 [Caenorhabditis remanei]
MEATEKNEMRLRFRQAECDAMKRRLAEREAFIRWDTVEIDDPEVLMVRGIYEDVNNCINSYSHLVEFFQNKMNWFNLHNSHFYKCILKLNKSPMPHERPCLGNYNFTCEKRKEICERYTELRNCTKQILEDSRGEKAADNYDYYVKVIRNHFGCSYIHLTHLKHGP